MVGIIAKIAIICSIIFLVQSSALCSDPLCSNPLTAHCNNGFCQCNTNLIFNCSTSSTSIALGTTSHNAVTGQKQYFVLETKLDSNVEHHITLSDGSNSDFTTIYDLGIYIDEGVGTSYSIPSGYAWKSSNTIQIVIQSTLTYISGTTIPQQLVLNVTYKASGTSSFNINYEYSETQWSSTMLILGYVAGGVLIVATIIMIVVMWRRSRLDDEARQRRRNGQDQKNSEDIGHFNALMPMAMVTPKIIKEGSACSVCLGQFDFNAMIRTTVCGHVFHVNCLDEWCVKNLSCPICRTNLSKESIMEFRNQQSKKESQSWVHNTLELSDESDDEEDSRKKNSARKMRQRQSELSNSSAYSSRAAVRQELIDNNNL